MLQEADLHQNQAIEGKRGEIFRVLWVEELLVPQLQILVQLEKMTEMGRVLINSYAKEVVLHQGVHKEVAHKVLKGARELLGQPNQILANNRRKENLLDLVVMSIKTKGSQFKM